MRKTIKTIINLKGVSMKIIKKIIIYFLAFCFFLYVLTGICILIVKREFAGLFIVIMTIGIASIFIYFLLKGENQYEKSSLMKESENLSGNDDDEKRQRQIIGETSKNEYEEEKRHIISEIEFKRDYFEKPKDLSDDNIREEIPFYINTFDKGSITNGIFLDREIMNRFPSQKYIVFRDFSYEWETLTLQYRIVKLMYYAEEEYWNSHGTDKNVTIYDYDVTVESAIKLLNQKKPEGYKTEIQRLEILGSILSQIKEHAGNIFARYFPDVCSVSILHVSECSAVFLAKDSKEQKTVIKAEMMCHEAVEDLKTLLVYLNTSDYSGNLMPVLEYAVIPSDPNSDLDILLIRMPYLIEDFCYGGKRCYPEESKNIDDRNWWKIRRFGSWAYGFDSAAALAELSSLGYVHLDVKPENIFYSIENGVCKAVLGDINSVRKVESQYAYTVRSTSALMSPELRLSEPYSFNTDVFSWGMSLLRKYVKEDLDMSEIEKITLEELISKEKNHRYRLSVKKKNTDEIISIYGHESEKQFPKLWNVVLNALKEDPADRIKDGSNLAGELERELINL